MPLSIDQILDPSLVSEINTKHIIEHRIIVSFDPAIHWEKVGGKIRNTLLAIILIYASCGLLKSVLNNRHTATNK